MKCKYTGMTLIEILMVAGIVIVLAGLLIPAMTLVRKVANQTKQRAELSTIELAITTFKNDYGDYPPSSYNSDLEDSQDYSGAQKLAEALCGWDLLGFEPNSQFRSDGYRKTPHIPVYSQNFTDPPSTSDLETLKSRKGPYLDMTSVSIFRVGDQIGKPGLFQTYNPLAPETYVLCDVFGVRDIQIGDKRGKAGTPILYYKANPASKDHMTSAQYANRIYNYDDNKYLIELKRLTPSGAPGQDHENLIGATGETYFYNTYIRDQRAPIPWPYKADSYILISAGADGEYGTKDDICNF